MDAKIFVYGFCLLAIIAGTGFWQYTMGIDEAEKELLLARGQVGTVDDSIKQAKAWLAARKEAAALIAAAKVIETDNQTLKDEVKKIKDKRQDVAKVFAASIERARSEMNGMVIPDLTLTNGMRLKNAKIQSLDEKITVIQHAEGVSKVPTENLPANLQDRLRFGFTPGGIGVSAGLSTGRSSVFSTSASDSLVKMGQSKLPDVKEPETSTVASPPPMQASSPATPAPAATEGQRQSLGRVYTPGKGWERTGAGGTIAAPSLSDDNRYSTKPSDAVSKVKSRNDMPSSSGRGY
jgi:cell division protein FtsB